MRPQDVFLKIGRTLISYAHIAWVDDDGDRIRIYFANTCPPDGPLEFKSAEAEEFRRQMNTMVLRNQGQEM